MQVRRVHAPKSFGRRRPTMEVPGQGEEGRPAAKSLLAWSLRVTLVIGLVAVAGAAQLAQWNKPTDGSGRTAARLAAGVIPVPVDPETTGAITQMGASPAARGTRLDPCLVPVTAPATSPVTLPAAGQLRP